MKHHLKQILNLNLLNALFGRIINVNPTHIIKWLLKVQILDYIENLDCAKHCPKSHTKAGKHAPDLQGD